MAGKQWAPKARGALGRYRVMAWVTGVMLLVLSAEIAIKYGLRPEESVLRWIEWIPFAHGWVYVIYLVSVIDLWSTMRWGLGRLVAMVLAGVVPVLSFVVERRVHTAGDAQIVSGRPGAGTPAPAVERPL